MKLTYNDFRNKKGWLTPMEKKVKSIEVYKYIKAHPGTRLREIVTTPRVHHIDLLPNIYELEAAGKIRRESYQDIGNMEFYYKYYAN